MKKIVLFFLLFTFFLNVDASEFKIRYLSLDNSDFITIIIDDGEISSKSSKGDKVEISEIDVYQTYFQNNDTEKYPLYITKEGKEYKVYNKCPHLGCSLNFNEVEKTWDCPCHSSRFDIDGKCLKGPSNYDISYNQNKTS